MPSIETLDDLHQTLKGKWNARLLSSLATTNVNSDLTAQFDDYIQQLWATERSNENVHGNLTSKLEEFEARMAEASIKVVIGELKDRVTIFVVS